MRNMFPLTFPTPSVTENLLCTSLTPILAYDLLCSFPPLWKFQDFHFIPSALKFHQDVPCYGAFQSLCGALAGALHLGTHSPGLTDFLSFFLVIPSLPPFSVSSCKWWASEFPNFPFQFLSHFLFCFEIFTLGNNSLKYLPTFIDFLRYF